MSLVHRSERDFQVDKVPWENGFFNGWLEASNIAQEVSGDFVEFRIHQSHLRGLRRLSKSLQRHFERDNIWQFSCNIIVIVPALQLSQCLLVPHLLILRNELGHRNSILVDNQLQLPNYHLVAKL